MPEANSSTHCFFLPVFLLPLFSLSSVFQLCLWIGFLHSDHEYTQVSSILGENKITLLLSLLSPVFSLPYLSWESYLNECSLYVTVEPCPMCAGALAWSQIGSVVYGTSDPKRGFSQFSPSLMHPKTVVVSGVLADECSNVVTEFFKSKR